MDHQSEKQLEDALIRRLNGLGWESVIIPDPKALVTNLRAQLEKFNDVRLTDAEFSRVLNHIEKGDRLRKAKTLRDRFHLKRDDGSDLYLRFFNMEKWCQNEYQVTHQITQFGVHENRYDVTLLVNGLPLVQVELKRRGLEMKEAFNQIQRYHRHSFTGTIFEYVQIFVISNGVNTKYFANNPRQSFEQTFFWTDAKNVKITTLDEFSDAFLEKCAVSTMIAEHVVLHESQKSLMVLRPYQYYAVEAIERCVHETDKGGYIWHTTGSGKTLTSFKASQVLAHLPEVQKILFVVDRKDLDTQTIREFNAFAPKSIDGTNNTSHLVEQLADTDAKKKLVVTTIQKLDVAIGRESYLKRFAHLADQKVVIIFDECHRGQFGLTHKRIKAFFRRAQMFGFTGTPIFADNNVGGVTTKDVFGDCLHKYIITDAISDNNVLGFAVEYVGRYKRRDPDTIDADIFAGEMVEGIDTTEVLESDKRLGDIADYVLADWKRKTKNGQFNAFFAAPSIAVLKKYYRLLKERKPEGMKLATVFTFKANEDQSTDLLDADASMDDDMPIDANSRDFLDDCIKEYNREFGTNFSTERFDLYLKDLQDRIKNKEIDLTLVVDMLLTGFDSKWLNTLYLDKNLRYHGLIQAYSRTNRTLDSTKPHGNIVSFRNLKEATDKALLLFGDENAKEVVFKKPYEMQKKEFAERLAALRLAAPTVASVDELKGEQERAGFVMAFRDLLRTKASLETFAEFSFGDVGLEEQEFYDYQSKYLDVYEERRNYERGAESVLDEIDFELELTIRDVINYDYIIKLIAGLKDIASDAVRQRKTEEVIKLFERETRLRSKRELIRRFIEVNLPHVADSASVEVAFSDFWAAERLLRLRSVAASEGISADSLEGMISDYLYSQHLPKGDDIIDLIPENRQPRMLERKTVIERIKNVIREMIDVFEW